MKNNRTVPAEVFTSPNLTATAKLFYAEILRQHSQHGVDDRTNEQLAEVMQIQIRSVQRLLRQLEEQDFIQVRYWQNNKAEREIFVKNVEYIPKNSPFIEELGKAHEIIENILKNA